MGIRTPLIEVLTHGTCPHECDFMNFVNRQDFKNHVQSSLRTCWSTYTSRMIIPFLFYFFIYVSYFCFELKILISDAVFHNTYNWRWYLNYVKKVSQCHKDTEPTIDKKTYWHVFLCLAKLYSFWFVHSLF